MLRIILIIALILLAIPFFNKAKDYFSEQSKKVKVIGETGVKFFKYKDSKKK